MGRLPVCKSRQLEFHRRRLQFVKLVDKLVLRRERFALFLKNWNYPGILEAI